MRNLNEINPTKQIKGLEVHPLANMVPMAIESEQDALTQSIKDSGQKESIMLYRGKIIDGRCRALACATLGIEVKKKELPNNMTLSEVENEVICLSTRRNLTTTQKAIVAYKNWESKRDNGENVSQAKIQRQFGVAKSQFIAAKFLLEEDPVSADSLFKGNKVSIGGSKESHSLQYVAKYVKKVLEDLEAVDTTIHNEEENLRLFDSVIKTEAGKEHFAIIVESLGGFDTECLSKKGVLYYIAKHADMHTKPKTHADSEEDFEELLELIS